MRILVFSDSLGLPRCHLPANERTEYEDVYGYQLREKLRGTGEVEICYMISLDTERAVSLAKYQIAFRRPDIVILHLGINDCAPRIFSRDSRNIIFRKWFPKNIKRMILGVIRRFRRPIIRYVIRNRVYVKPHSFRDNLKTIQNIVHKYSPHCQFLVISILPTTAQLNHRSYSFNSNVARYNAIMREVFPDSFIDLDDLLGGIPESYLISDGIHLTGSAHAMLANSLYEHILQLMKGNENLSK